MSTVARVAWEWTESGDRTGVVLPHVFARWHSANRLGLELARVELRGETLEELELTRLNYFVAAGGAWRCSLLSHFECERVLAHALQRRFCPILGVAGGGRWSASSRAEEVLGNGRKGVRDAAGLQIGELRDDERGKFVAVA